MTERMNIALHANLDDGHGYMTATNTEKLAGLADYSTLLALDVIGDWKGLISYEYDMVLFTSDASWLKNGEYTPRSIAITIYRTGYNVIDSTVMRFVEGIPDLSDDDARELANKIVESAREDDFMDAVRADVKARAEALIDKLMAGEMGELNKITDYEILFHRTVAETLISRIPKLNQE